MISIRFTPADFSRLATVVAAVESLDNPNQEAVGVIDSFVDVVSASLIEDCEREAAINTLLDPRSGSVRLEIPEGAIGDFLAACESLDEPKTEGRLLPPALAMF